MRKSDNPKLKRRERKCKENESRMTDEIQKLKKRDIRKKKVCEMEQRDEREKREWETEWQVELVKCSFLSLEPRYSCVSKQWIALLQVGHDSCSSGEICLIIIIACRYRSPAIAAQYYWPLKICVRAGGSKPAAPHQVLYSLGVLPTTVHVGPWGQSLAEGWKCTVVLVTSLP